MFYTGFEELLGWVSPVDARCRRAKLVITLKITPIEV